MEQREIFATSQTIIERMNFVNPLMHKVAKMVK